MKINFILTLTFLSVLFQNCLGQKNNINQLLNKIDKAIDKVSEGRYTLNETLYKTSVGEDSEVRSRRFRNFFKKLLQDSLIGYQLASFADDGYEQIYDGRTSVSLTASNKTLEIVDKTKYPDKVKRSYENYQSFPLFKFLGKPLNFLNEDVSLHKVILLGTERFKGEKCYKIETIIAPDTNKNKYRSFVFVSTKSYLPVGFNMRTETFTGQAKEVETWDIWSSDFKQVSVPEKQFTKEALTEYNKETQYNPDNTFKNPLLAIGTQAPQWELPSLDGANIKLSDLKGKIVIMDFWYKRCPPCQKQMIELQELHNKFDKNQVVFVGINTIDDPIKDKLDLFLKNRNITMTSVYNGKTIENLYKAYSSPALFIINKEGKIVHTIDGYSKNLLEDISKTIEKLL